MKVIVSSLLFDICLFVHRMLVPVQTIIEAMGIECLKSRDEKGHIPAHWACLGGHTTILRYLIEMKAPVDEPSENELGQRPIHWACVNGHIAVVDVLLQTGVNLDVTDNKGCSPLIVASQYGKTMLAGYLMGKGARLQLVDKDGDTALHWAAFKGNNLSVHIVPNTFCIFKVIHFQCCYLTS